MPSYIVKASPDEDYYVMWSDVVDAPTFAGTRADMEAEVYFTPQEVAADRFSRADEWGTSCQAAAGGTVYRFYDWASPGFAYERQGYLPRARLRELCDRLGRDEPVTDLLEPFDDDTEGSV